MSMNMTIDTLPAGTVCKTYDTGTLDGIDIYNNRLGVNMEFQPFQFKEVVKAYLTGETDWRIDSQFTCEVRPLAELRGKQPFKSYTVHKDDPRYALLIRQAVITDKRREQSVLIGPEDFYVVVDYWMTNTQIRKRDARLVLLEEIEDIQPAEPAQKVYDLLFSLELIEDDAFGQRRFYRRVG